MRLSSVKSSSAPPSQARLYVTGRPSWLWDATVKKQNSRCGAALEDVLKEATKIRRQRYEIRTNKREKARLEDAGGALPKETKGIAATVDDTVDNRRAEGPFRGSHVGGAELIPAESSSRVDLAILNAIDQSAELVPTPRPRDSGENAASIAGDEPGAGGLTATMRAMVDSIEQLADRIDSLVLKQRIGYYADEAFFRSAALATDVEREFDEDDKMSTGDFRNFNSLGN